MGTITMVFTDVEGSTRLLRALGDRYGETLAELRRILRTTWARHGGVEVDTRPPWSAARDDRIRELAVSRLGEEGFQRELERGRRLTLDEVCEAVSASKV